VNRDTVDVIAAAWASELPGVIGAELELGKRAARLSAMLGERVNAELARLGLTKGEYEILAVLRAAGAPYRLRPSDLTNRLLLTSGGTSNLLRRLADADLVEREADASDARSSWVRLSGKGVTIAEEAVRSASAAQAALLRGVPAETVRTAIDALRDVLIALDDTADVRNIPPVRARGG
jgi:DNA-binding MarR family transcriptional regulator